MNKLESPKLIIESSSKMTKPKKLSQSQQLKALVVDCGYICIFSRSVTERIPTLLIYKTEWQRNTGLPDYIYKDVSIAEVVDQAYTELVRGLIG